MDPDFEEEKRKFEFAFEQFFASYKAFNEDDFNKPLANEKWSIAQTIFHLNLSTSNSLAYISKKIRYPETIPQNVIMAYFRSNALRILLRSRIKFKAPQGLDKIPQNISFFDLEQEWQSNKLALNALLEEFPMHLKPKSVFRHPFLGRITMLQTIVFFRQHVNHHARQVEQYLQIGVN